MKNSLIAFILTANLYSKLILSYDLDTSFNLQESFDAPTISSNVTNVIEIGYEFGKDNFSYGISYIFSKPKFDDFISVEARTINIYSKYYIYKDYYSSPFITLGLSNPIDDLDSFKTNLFYGIGIKFSSGIGIYYNIFPYTEDEYNEFEEYTFKLKHYINRMGISLTF